MKKLITLLALASLVLVRASAQEAYAVYADNTLTFYYDTEKNSRSGKVFALADATANGPAWYSDVRATRDKRIIVTRVIFHSSFAAARPTTTYRWFAYLEDLQQIDGLQHLNTADVRKMSEMFGYCSSLTSLDLSGFNTDKVTDMSLMFSGCSSLESLNLSSFNTANVTNMAGMFNGCRQLASLDLSGFNTAKVTSISAMFTECQRLTSLDLGSFNTAQVTTMNATFRKCIWLRTIYVGSSWTNKNVKYSNEMFLGCHSIVGGQGTQYAWNRYEASYARIDGGPSAPGYLTAKAYDLHVGGTQVTGANAGDILGNGRAVFDAATNTLTLRGANIRVSGVNGFGIYSTLEEPLTVVLEGKNTVSSADWTGIFTDSGITLQGPGQLALNGRTGISVGGAGTATTVAVREGAEVTVAATASGITGSTNREQTAYYTTLAVEGRGTRLAITAPSGAAVRLKSLSLGDGLEIVEPAGGSFVARQHAICSSAREVATEVVIASAGNPYDLNKDGSVDVSDVTELVSYVLNPDGSHATDYDLNKDSAVDISDVTELVSAVLAQ